MFKIGTDLVNISRMQAKIEKHGLPFLHKIFTATEIKDSERYFSSKLKAAHFAKRFAAKEAYIKAAGFDKIKKIKNLAIHNTCDGAPYFTINNILVPHVKLTLSDDTEYAIAFVIIEQNE